MEVCDLTPVLLLVVGDNHMELSSGTEGGFPDGQVDNPYQSRQCYSGCHFVHVGIQVVSW